VNTAFSYGTRVLMCTNCGAPLPAASGAGDYPCGHCRAVNRVGVRDERPVAGGGPRAPLGPVIGAGGGLGITGLILLAVALPMRKAERKAARIRLHGVRANGRIANLAPTGMLINHVPQMKIDLLVEMEGKAPYQASTKMLVPQHALAQIQPGAVLPLRVDPDNPMELIVEAD
jgi:hypothetical protein